MFGKVKSAFATVAAGARKAFTVGKTAIFGYGLYELAKNYLIPTLNKQTEASKVNTGPTTSPVSNRSSQTSIPDIALEPITTQSDTSIEYDG